LKRNSRSKSPTRRHTHTDFEQTVKPRTEDDLFHEILPAAETPFVLILDQVQDPHNLGACLRTADAAGVHAVIVPKDNSVTLTDTVRRVACGAAENVPFVMVTNLARAMQRLKDAGIWLVGTDDTGTDLLYNIDLKGPLGIVMGAEGKGVRRLTRENCDFLAKIPMAGTVECLNVSVATGVCLYEAVRQRQL
jgi:23S rRNA (guanosine2251-2'-O)-methyltransferase